MLFGLLILTAGALALIPLESWVHQSLAGISGSLAEHFLLPLARIALIVLFLYAIYPSPMLAPQVLALAPALPQGHPPWSNLLNALFIASLILPLFPETQRFGAVILPLQSLLGALLFIHHFEDITGLDLRLPGGNAWMPVFVGALLLNHFGLRFLASSFKSRYGWDALSSYDAMALISQPPLILLFSRSFVAS